jgi:hypothetical protein
LEPGTPRGIGSRPSIGTVHLIQSAHQFRAFPCHELPAGKFARQLLIVNLAFIFGRYNLRSRHS